MSEQQSETATATATADKQDEPDDSEPSLERQAELRAAYEQNVTAGKPPYAGVILHTRGEIHWIVQERGWRTGGFYTREQAIDFRLVGVQNAVLSHVALTYANLSGAVIGEGDFSGANLTVANLSGAVIAGDFSGANLTQARMDSTTVLGSSDAEDAGETFQLDAQTRLLDVAWNGAILANVRWEQVPRLGDEADIEDAESRTERVEALRNAARAYRGLAKALQAQGLTIPALRYRAREQQLERRALLYSFALGPWLFSWLLNIVSGYGDKPGRALACYLAVVGTFTGAYWATTNQVFGFIQSQSTHLAWYEALVLSVSSFHGRGFFPSMLSLGDPIALIAAAEAIIGLFIELVFIATFTQRFFAR